MWDEVLAEPQPDAASPGLSLGYVYARSISAVAKGQQSRASKVAYRTECPLLQPCTLSVAGQG